MAKEKGRRAPGEGSVYRRKDGRWAGQYVAETATGQRKKKHVYGKTRKEAASRLRAALAERDSGLVYDDGNMSVGEYLDRWLDTVRDTVKHRTWERHELNVRRHLKPVLGALRLKKLSPLQVQSLYREKLDEGLSARSVELIHCTLYKALKQAVRWRLTPCNVCEDVDPPRPARREIRPLSPARTRALLEEVRDQPLEALYVLAVTTGMRQGELLGLRWEDVDFEARTLSVRRTAWGGSASAPKNARSRRSIRLSTLAIRSLRRRHETVTSEWMFPGRTGLAPVDCHSIIRHSWGPLRQRLGLSADTRFHDLRHTCATLLLGRGVHPKLVQELLGHSDIATTMNTYSHVVPAMHGATATAMDSVLTPRTEGSTEGTSLVALEVCEYEQTVDPATGA